MAAREKKTADAGAHIVTLLLTSFFIDNVVIWVIRSSLSFPSRILPLMARNDDELSQTQSSLSVFEAGGVADFSTAEAHGHGPWKHCSKGNVSRFTGSCTNDHSIISGREQLVRKNKGHLFQIPTFPLPPQTRNLSQDQRCWPARIETNVKYCFPAL